MWVILLSSWCRGVHICARGERCGAGLCVSRTRRRASCDFHSLAIATGAAPSPSRRGPPVSQPQRFPCRYLVAWQLFKTMWRRNNKPIYFIVSIFVPNIVYDLSYEELLVSFQTYTNVTANENKHFLVNHIFHHQF